MRYALVLTLLLGCGDDDGGVAVDVGIVDSGVDSGADGVDAGGSDSGVDSGVDSGGGDTWETFAATWLETFCTECHAGGRRDYTTPAEVMRDRETIRCGVSPDRPLEGCGSSPRASQFPIGDGPFPTDEERRRFVAWLDAGMP